MPFNLKKLSERRVELMTQLENLVKTCETETRAFNEEEQKQYNDILTEVRSIDATLDAADQGAALQKVEHRAAGGQVETRSQEELETRAFECYIRGIAADTETRAAVNMTVGDNGAVIPTSIANKIIEMVKEISPLYHLSTHYDVGGTLTIPSYDESTQKISMTYATEFTALTSTSGKFTSISLGGFLAGALTKISMSLVNNSKFDIVSYVIRKMAEAVSEWIDPDEGRSWKTRPPRPLQAQLRHLDYHHLDAARQPRHRPEPAGELCCRQGGKRRALSRRRGAA